MPSYCNDPKSISNPILFNERGLVYSNIYAHSLLFPLFYLHKLPTYFEAILSFITSLNYDHTVHHAISKLHQLQSLIPPLSPY